MRSKQDGNSLQLSFRVRTDLAFLLRIARGFKAVVAYAQNGSNEDGWQLQLVLFQCLAPFSFILYADLRHGAHDPQRTRWRVRKHRWQLCRASPVPVIVRRAIRDTDTPARRTSRSGHARTHSDGSPMHTAHSGGSLAHHSSFTPE
jgi:hypothetical protein